MTTMHFRHRQMARRTLTS